MATLIDLGIAECPWCQGFGVIEDVSDGSIPIPPGMDAVICPACEGRGRLRFEVELSTDGHVADYHVPRELPLTRWAVRLLRGEGVA